MGRLKIKTELKKQDLSVTISLENYQKLENLEVTNKSKLINWLLQKHFGMFVKGGSYGN
jgi:hypothetical protein